MIDDERGKSDWLRSYRAPEIVERRVRVPAKIQKRRRQFVQVPWVWIEQLAKARHIASYRVALYVLYQHWKNAGEPFTLSNAAVEGVARGTKWRALRELEQIGLITIERRQRKAPRVNVVG
jgi:predicted transcriptional regulator